MIDIALQRVLNWHAADSHDLFKVFARNGIQPLVRPRKALAGKCAIVTGANTGLGLETARWLTANGATVVLACRCTDKASSAAADIRESVPDADIEVAALDLSDFSSVRRFAANFMSSNGHSEKPRPVHMLILNAGVMVAPRAVPETHFMVNHVAHALLAILLLPSLAEAAREHARIVVVSSVASLVSNLDLEDIHFRKRRYNGFGAYANSKLCNILFVQALTSRLRHTNIICNAVHPGESTTDVSRHLGRVWMTLHKRVGSLFLLSPQEAARSIVYAAAASKAADKPGAVFHVVDRVLSIPGHLLSVVDEDRLWAVTLNTACVTSDELKAARAAGLDDPFVRSHPKLG